MAAAGKKRKRRSAFSTVKAVKLNARTLVGQPRTTRVLLQRASADQPPRFRPSVAERLDVPVSEQ